MKPTAKPLIALALMALLAACVSDDTYPVSGEQCTGADPVADMDANDFNCAPSL